MNSQSTLYSEAGTELSASQAVDDSQYTDFESFCKDCLEFLINSMVELIVLALVDVILIKGYLV